MVGLFVSPQFFQAMDAEPAGAEGDRPTAVDGTAETRPDAIAVKAMATAAVRLT
ncbi:hypothetical protein [Wenjunlia tyrosinilytica]|uniref:Uncharacterized protein n=1 Tax=Wenjunlia tyrosinilytica TaxID=1544741 RepID=A0A917ZRA5_9ACTN|nr:hypothetical protein GCM10012280_37580 [Wenjunlia tyrosinilytica]